MSDTEQTEATYKRRYGSRFEVFDSQVALQTRGGLKKEDLMLNAQGKIVSKKKSMAAKDAYSKGLSFKKKVVEKPKKKTRKKRKKKDE